MNSFGQLEGGVRSLETRGKEMLRKRKGAVMRRPWC